MAGAMSGHLLESFNATKPTNLVYSGPMSFNASMHGSQAFAPYFFGTQSSYMSEDISEATAKKIATLQAKLNQKLGPEYISQRPGPSGGPKLTYAEGWKIINLANEVFGFNGWSSSLVNITTDFVDYNEESKRYSVGVTAIVRVTLRDGVYHEDVGYGMLENSKSKGMALDKCKKEAVTDGLKRALRNFGNLLGNCIYDKAYTQEIVKMKVVPPKFDPSELHRRPEFDVKPTSSSNANAILPEKPSNNAGSVNKSIHPAQQSSNTLSSLPPHIKNEVRPVASVTARRSGSPQTPLHQHQNIPISPVSITHQGRTTNDRMPQQLNQQPQRKVTFSNTINKSVNGTVSRPLEPIASSSKTEVLEPEKDNFLEESFGYSEDDAFFASVDLEDLGRPIDNEVDGGRPINFDEGLGNTSMESVTKDANRFHVGAPPQRTGPATGMLSALLPQQSRRTQQSNLPSKQTLYQDQNVPPAKPITHTKRTATPSIGGFHFPPGMDPFDQYKSSGQSNQTFNARAGVKRPAESVNTPTGYQSGFKRGMGLQQQVGPTNYTGGREILGQLDIGEGGDVKRIKR